MKKIIICQIVFSVVLMNCQEKKAEKITSKAHKTDNTINNSQKEFDFKELKFGSNINDLLKGIGLSSNDNALDEYNISGDYEEFQFPKDKNINLSIFNNTLQSGTDNISVFYLKTDKKIWGYEMELINNSNAETIISSIEKRVGHKPDFAEKKVNTKERPIFLDENGEFKKDHIVENIQVWEDKGNKTVYFTIYTANFSKNPNENRLKVFVLDKASVKYKEWISYRSLDMLYNK